MIYIINDEEIQFTQIPSTGATSTIYISVDNKYIIKQIIYYKEYDVYKREKYILSLLNEHHFDWWIFPLLKSSSGSIQTGHIFEITKNDYKILYNFIIYYKNH